MIPDWMTVRDVFIDIHDRLRPFAEIKEILETVERTWDLKKYFNGSNLGGRWIFQVYSREFVSELANLINTINQKCGRHGPIVEVMSGDGVLTKFLTPLVDHKIIATDAKSDRYRIAFSKEVETITALESIEKYDPSVVIMSWEPFLSMDAIDIVRKKIPLIWIGQPDACGHPELVLSYCKDNGTDSCIRATNQYTIGRHDSLLKRDFKTDVLLFNCERDWFV
ncbi:MAG: hypothetical protein ACTSYL_10245 [Candidatus Thorarchaeota archaeon]